MALGTNIGLNYLCALVIAQPGATRRQRKWGNLPDALAYFRAMLGGGGSSEITALLGGQLYAPGNLVVMAIAAGLLFARRQAHDWSEEVTWPKVAVVFPLFLLSLLGMFSQASNPFLYFQF